MPDVSRETSGRLRSFLDRLIEENTHHNLISRQSSDDPWTRHIVDSLQLMSFAPSDVTSWLDIGSGGGLPGLVIAIAMPHLPVTLVEPRRLRAAFLAACIDELAIGNAIVVQSRLEAMPARSFGVISARAVASLASLFTMAHRFATPETIWLLPKGQSADRELADARRSWHGNFHIEPSCTDDTSGIIVARDIHARAGR